LVETQAAAIKAAIVEMRGRVDDEQIDILAEYQKLKAIDNFQGIQLNHLRDLWWALAGQETGGHRRQLLLKWLRLFGQENLTKSMYEAATSLSFVNIGKFSIVRAADEAEPGMRMCYFIRGILRKRFAPMLRSEPVVLRELLHAAKDGADLGKLRQVAASCSSEVAFWNYVGEARCGTPDKE
jgi:hypothetical protein